jgi:starvation-inducible DNA-binding protein
MTPKLGIKPADCQALVRLLNRLLADEYLLYVKTRNYHWNVTGMQFNDLHKFFEAQYEAIEGFVDDVAERARTLGGRANGSLTEFLRDARLKEQPGQLPAAPKMIANLLADHETLVRQLRKDVETADKKHEDAGTADFLTGLMEHHEKMAWMLRAFLER